MVPKSRGIRIIRRLCGVVAIARAFHSPIFTCSRRAAARRTIASHYHATSDVRREFRGKMSSVVKRPIEDVNNPTRSTPAAADATSSTLSTAEYGGSAENKTGPRSLIERSMIAAAPKDE